MSMSPGSAQIPIGGASQLTAIGNYSNGSTNISSLSYWSSSDTNVATVSSSGLVRGISSGTATITASYTYFSNTFTSSATITVTTQYAPPQISESTYPIPNLAGWTHQNTVVTFVCTPGGLPIASCTGPQTLTNEGTNQVVTGTATDTAQTSVSTSVTLNIDKTPPVLAVSSPADRTIFTSSSITITGTASDNLSGLSSVTCNGQTATMNGVTFSCSLTLQVGTNLVIIKTLDLAGNVSSLILHEFLAGVLSNPNSLQITPASINILVGGTQQFTAVDNLGRPRSDAAWTVSNTNVATITPDSSPILRAIAPGQVTLTANTGSASAQVQVTISPGGPVATGTVLWSAPLVPGYSPLQMVQAMPSPTGPNVYSIQSTNNGLQTLVQAFTADGQQMWQTILPTVNTNSMADGFGGLIVTENNNCDGPNPMSVVDLDGETGTAMWQVTGQSSCTVNPPQIAIRQDGGVVLSAPGNTSGFPELTVLDGPTGQPISYPQVPESTYTDQFGNTLSGYSPIGTPIVDSDGTAYVEYEVRQIDYATVVSATVSLLKIAPDGTVTTIPLSSTTNNSNLFPGTVVPDGQGGVVATWVISPASAYAPPPPHPYQAAHVTSGGMNVYDMPVPVAPQRVIIGTDGLPLALPIVIDENAAGYVSYGPDTVSFDLNSGALAWDHQTNPQSTLSVMAALSGGGATVIDSQNGVVQLDSGGNPSQATGALPSVPQYSWDGNQLVLQTPQGTSALQAPPVVIAPSTWALFHGNQSGNGVAIDQVQSNQQQGFEHQLPPSGSNLYSNYNSLELLTAASPDLIFSQYIQTFAGAHQLTNGVGFMPDDTNVTGPNQILKVTLAMPLRLGQAPFNIETERFDPTAHTISVVTLTGHPLAGWRYWRVYSIGTNDVVIETGAVDRQGPGLKNFAGYWLFQGFQEKMWRDYLQFILFDIHNWDPSAVQGSNPLYNRITGEFEPTTPSQVDILENVCESAACN